MNLMKTKPVAVQGLHPTIHTHNIRRENTVNWLLSSRSIATVCAIGVSDICNCEQSLLRVKKTNVLGIVVEAVAVSVFLCDYIQLTIGGNENEYIYFR